MQLGTPHHYNFIFVLTLLTNYGSMEEVVTLFIDLTSQLLMSHNTRGYHPDMMIIFLTIYCQVLIHQSI